MRTNTIAMTALSVDEVKAEESDPALAILPRVLVKSLMRVYTATVTIRVPIPPITADKGFRFSPIVEYRYSRE